MAVTTGITTFPSSSFPLSKYSMAVLFPFLIKMKESSVCFSLVHFIMKVVLCLIKGFFSQRFKFILFFVLSLFYRCSVCRHFITAFGVSSICYDVLLFVVLLQHFICVGTIQTRKIDLISRKHQIMIVSMLKN